MGSRQASSVISQEGRVSSPQRTRALEKTDHSLWCGHSLLTLLSPPSWVLSPWWPLWEFFVRTQLFILSSKAT